MKINFIEPSIGAESKLRSMRSATGDAGRFGEETIGTFYIWKEQKYCARRGLDPDPYPSSSAAQPGRPLKCVLRFINRGAGIASLPWGAAVPP